MSNAFEEAIRRHGDQEFVLDTRVNDKFRVVLQVLVNGGFWIIAWSPRTVTEHIFRQVLHDGIEHHTVAFNGSQRGIGLKFREDVLMSVIAI